MRNFRTPGSCRRPLRRAPLHQRGGPYDIRRIVDREPEPHDGVAAEAGFEAGDPELLLARCRVVGGIPLLARLEPDAADLARLKSEARAMLLMGENYDESELLERQKQSAKRQSMW